MDCRTSLWHAEIISLEYLTLQGCYHLCPSAETTAVCSDHDVMPEDFPLSSSASASDQYWAQNDPVLVARFAHQTQVQPELTGS